MSNNTDSDFHPKVITYSMEESCNSIDKENELFINSDSNLYSSDIQDIEELVDMIHMKNGDIKVPINFPRIIIIIVNKCYNYYINDSLLQSIKCIEEIESYFNKKSNNLNDKKAENINHLQFIDSLPFIIDIKSKHIEVLSLLVNIQCDDGWHSISDSDDIATFYRAEPNTSLHSIKIRATFNCPLINLLSLVNEVDLMPKFFNILPITAECIEQRSLFSKLAYFTYNFWPFSRDILVGVEAYDFLEDGKIILVGQSEKGHSTSYTRMDVDLCGTCLHLKSPTSTFIEVIFRVNPNLSYIPSSLLNFFTHNFAYYGTLLFRNKCKDLDKPWLDRMTENPKFYKEVERRIASYYENL